MKFIVVLITGAIVLVSCSNPGIAEGNWVDVENEKELLAIKKEDGRFWLHLHNRQMTVNTEGRIPFVTIRDQEYPILLNPLGDTLTFASRAYVLLENSLKGRFTGRWRNASGDTVFLVQIDDNRDLTWDIIRKAEQPVRFWPKRTSSGYHFSLGKKTFTYVLKDGYLMDQEGNKYFRESGL
jgi:hypothetical protein